MSSRVATQSPSSSSHHSPTTSPTSVPSAVGDDEDPIPPNFRDRMIYTKALDTIGAGVFHWKLLALAGWVNASDAVEILAVSFLLPSATHDLALTSSQKGWLAAVIFIGMMLGGWIWGTVADRIGRRSCLIISLLVNSFAGFLSAFSTGFWLLMMWRFFAGLGVGGSIPVVWSYFAEFLPVRSRGAFMVYMAMFWMAGSLLIGGMAWIIIPSSISFPLFGLNFNSWRIFCFLCGLPALTSVLTLIPAFESPRFLLSQGNIKDCVHILKYMHRVNCHRKWCGTPPHVENEQQFDELAPDILATTDDEEIEEEEKARLTASGGEKLIGGKALPSDGIVSPSNATNSSLSSSPTATANHGSTDGANGNMDSIDPPLSKWSRFTRDAKYSVLNGFNKNMSLFRVSHRRSTILCCLIFFGLSFGYYGLTMFIPQYFTDMEGAVDVYMSSFLGAAANLPGNLVSIWSVKAIGRGKTLGISLFLSSIAIFAVLLAESGYQVVVMMCIFSGMSIAAWNASNIIVVELFPTRIRSTAFGFFAGLGRMGAIFGNLAFGEFSTTHPAVPIVCVAICLCIAAIASMILPDTRNALMT